MIRPASLQHTTQHNTAQQHYNTQHTTRHTTLHSTTTTQHVVQNYTTQHNITTQEDMKSTYTNSEDTTVSRKSAGFEEFKIAHRESLGGGRYKYAIVELGSGAPRESVHLSGVSSSKDPLRSIQHVKFKVKKEDKTSTIIGIQVDKDCVVRKK